MHRATKVPSEIGNTKLRLNPQPLNHMPYTQQQLDAVYRRSSGCCHLCHKKLARTNHGVQGARGAWHVDHSIPRSKGGTDHLNNLFAACIKCNIGKSNKTTRTARRWKGKARAPLSLEKRQQAKSENGMAGAIAGGLAGAAFAGPFGAFVGAVTGACIGSSENPDRV